MALLTMAAVGICFRTPSIGGFLEWKLFQYLGGISYSLYLTHGFFGQRVANLGLRTTGHGDLSAWFWFFAAIASAVVGAHVFWRFFEVPSILWSRRFQIQTQAKFPAV